MLQILSLFLYSTFLITTVQAPQPKIVTRGLQQSLSDALQDQRLDMIERDLRRNRDDLDRVIMTFGDMKSSMDRFTGIGIGFGATLTVIQILQIVVQLKQKNQPEPHPPHR